MRVSLGTLDIDDAQRKAIRKDLGKGGHATREDVKAYLGAVIETALAHAGSGLVKPMTGADETESQLPEPTAGGTTASTTGGTGGTTPSTGNLGSDGTAGGTV